MRIIDDWFPVHRLIALPLQLQLCCCEHALGFHVCSEGLPVPGFPLGTQGLTCVSGLGCLTGTGIAAGMPCWYHPGPGRLPGKPGGGGTLTTPGGLSCFQPNPTCRASSSFQPTPRFGFWFPAKPARGSFSFPTQELFSPTIHQCFVSNAGPSDSLCDQHHRTYLADTP